MIVEGMSDVDSNISSDSDNSKEGGEESLANYASVPSNARKGSMVDRNNYGSVPSTGQKRERRGSEKIFSPTGNARASIFSGSRRSSMANPERPNKSML